MLIKDLSNFVHQNAMDIEKMTLEMNDDSPLVLLELVAGEKRVGFTSHQRDIEHNKALWDSTITLVTKIIAVRVLKRAWEGAWVARST
jgi:hypothetical protein